MKIEPQRFHQERPHLPPPLPVNDSGPEDAAERFEESPSPEGDTARQEGLRQLILDKNATATLEKSVTDAIVKPLGLPDPDGGYYQHDCIARNAGGTTAALVKRGPHMDSPRDLVLFDPSMQQKSVISTTACKLYGAPDGTFLLLGRKGYSDPTLVTSYTPDGTQQWSVNLNEHGLSPFIESVQVNSRGEALIVHNSSEASIVKGGEVTKITSSGPGHQLCFDELGTCYDCDLYTSRPSYTMHDGSGRTRKRLLPRVPGVTGDDYSGRGDSPKRLDDHHVLTDGSVVVTATPLKAGMPATYLLKPGATKPIELAAKDYTIVRESVQGPGGTICSVALRLGAAKTPGSAPPAERALIAFNDDGSEKWRAPLPSTESGAGREKVFMDSRGHVLVFSNFLEGRTHGGSPGACCLQAFDTDGSPLWSRTFRDPMDLLKADAHRDGSMDLLFDGGPGSLIHLAPFDRGSVETLKENTIAENAGKEGVTQGVTVDQDESLVIIGGIKLPINRSFRWIH
ncbi:MAG: hypothetical protein RDV48_24040 [Candidatus Eremiobacteraeota bacterium]|nr:hypothetical protein [Candidatus Eremiobacteraeota bacterium]